MQSGRVSPLFRQFFSTALTSKGATDSNSQNQQQQSDREPSDEEAKAAFQFLLEQEELKAQGLKVELKLLEGRHCIAVIDSAGNQLRTIKGIGILKVLETRALGKTGHQLGRILDRRL